MPKIKVTKQECELITRQAERIFKHREGLSRTDGNKEKKSSYALLKQLNSKMKGVQPAEDGTVLKLVRTEIRLIEQMTKSSIDILNSSTIPGYMKRIDAKEEVERHTEYMNKAIKLRDDVLQPLLAKVQGAL